MRLDRNISCDGRGKYGLINSRRLAEIKAFAATGEISASNASKISEAIKLLETYEVLDWGPPGSQSEFFVIMLRDQFADDALRAYADAAGADAEYAEAIDDLVARAGRASPFCKKPD